jgi:hypothetical protein
MSGLNFFRAKGSSKIQEQFAEHTILRDIILEAACKNQKIGIARGECDIFGYAIILEYKNEFKKIQLKATSGKAHVWDVHKTIIESGCVILIELVEDAQNEFKVKYHLLKKELKNKILNQPPKVSHPEKRKVTKGQFDSMEGNLLKRIFN